MQQSRVEPLWQSTSDKEKILVLLSEIRQCINDDRLMAAQRKIMAIESILQEIACNQ